MPTRSFSAAGKQIQWKPLDRDDQKPLYRQIKQNILDLIKNATLAAGAKLPSERELIAKCEVSRITIRQALVELVQEGYLQSQPGKGFYVAQKQEPLELHSLTSFTAGAHSRGMKPGSLLLDAKIFAASVEIARALDLPDGTEVALLKRLRLLDGVPVAIQYDWLPNATCPGLLDLDWSAGNRSLYAELAERYHIHPASGQTTISARLPDTEERRLLGLDRSSAVLLLDQIQFASDGRPINVSTSIHHPKRHPLSIHQGS